PRLGKAEAGRYMRVYTAFMLK
ncbi:MAG: hypothetical protein PWQ57_2982, partial [Desulfovibrionales bacterium]|nr:hypothetical protein [Desulfovibrionales bacterium]